MREWVSRDVPARAIQVLPVTALFHDAGYLRRLEDTANQNGAELTLTHVSRGARFLRSYLPAIGIGAMAGAAAALIHFTGYEVPVGLVDVEVLMETRDQGHAEQILSLLKQTGLDARWVER